MINLVTGENRTEHNPNWLNPDQSYRMLIIRGSVDQEKAKHECSPVNLLHIFRTLFPTNISGWLLL